MIKVFAVGDVVGRAGRRALAKMTPKIKEQYAPDVILINGENAAGGYGLTQAIYQQFTDELEVDCVTMGNHWHDNKEIFEFVEKADRLVLPANMGNVSDESMGLKLIPYRKNGRQGRFAVVNLIGRAFMHEQNRSPYDAVARLMAKIPNDVKLKIVDMHAEATSEKQALAYFLREKASLVYGTHSHVPTADHRIVDKFTGFVTDIGATAAYDSIIGMDKDAALKRLLTGARIRLEPAEADPWLCAIYAEIDEDTGACHKIDRVIWKLKELEEN